MSRKKAIRLRRYGRECTVHWGSHSCRKPPHHIGRHLCSPGCPHPDTYTAYGLSGRDALASDPAEDMRLREQRVGARPR